MLVAGAGLEGCKALERLHVEVTRVGVPITSPTLRHLSVRAHRSGRGQPLLTLTDLPTLTSLHLLQVPTLEVPTLSQP